MRDLNVQEIKPCPYVNGFSSDNYMVGFVVQYYGEHFALVTFENGKPARCFRFNRDPEITRLREAIKVARDALSCATVAAESFPDIHDGRTPAEHIIEHLHEWEAEHLAGGKVIGLEKALTHLDAILKEGK